MEIKINDKPFQIEPGTTLEKALGDAGVNPRGVATAVNGDVVPASERSTKVLADGDTILVIKAFYGG